MVKRKEAIILHLHSDTLAVKERGICVWLAAGEQKTSAAYKILMHPPVDGWGGKQQVVSRVYGGFHKAEFSPAAF